MVGYVVPPPPLARRASRGPLLSGVVRIRRIYRYRCYSKALGNFKEEPRINPVGIQYLSKSLHNQLFGHKKHSKKEDAMSHAEQKALVNLSKQFLKNFDLLGKKTSISEPISFELPKLQGKSLDEHFQKLGHYASEPYKTMCTKKFRDIVPRPKKWLKKPGWTRYEPGKDPQEVPSPLEDTLVFDVETMYMISSYPTLAVALSDKAWYLWCSPFICGSENFEHLIPMDSLDRTRVIIGHNVGYDRARVLDEYNFKPSKAFYLDTQSLHVASSGLCSRQRPQFVKNKKLRQSIESDEQAATDLSIETLEEDPWLNLSAMNSLHDVAFLHCGIRMNKEPREFFSTTDKNDIINNFQQLTNYCATDVEVTSKVFDKVFPLFLEKCPHPVSFGALRSLSSCILPTRHNKWDTYLKSSEKVYQESKQDIEKKIIKIVDNTLKSIKSERFMETINNDPWLRQLDWTIKPLKLTKKGVPVKNQKLPDHPEWYRSLFPNKNAATPHITIKSRSIPIFFRLSWEGSPVIWTNDNGWCFAVQKSLKDEYKAKNYILADEPAMEQYLQEISQKNPAAAENHVLFKIPHPNGPENNCTTLLSKPYIHFFEKGILTSESEFAHDALKINSCGSYWMSARERILSQFVVPQSSFPNAFKPLKDGKEKFEDHEDLGIILPTVIPMGTVTRRAVENTWLTASNAKSNRIGSELKAQIEAPKGYCFVGADVDSEELWIASLVSDSVFNIHGGTAIGWMCLEGSKNEGTDLHTKTAQILGCSRSEAKIFNYGRIYGAGVKFAAQLLKKFNPSLPDEEAKSIANKLYESTKGKTKTSKIFKKFWYGGSESILFNKLESIAEQDEPKTPVLGCGITFSLMKKNLGTSSFLPSRINWAIQSSGVDYLHLLSCSMHYLISKYNINARLSISIHDEIRFLVAEEDKYRAAMALQVSNIWTRAIFCEQMGIDDLPQNCAFFSLVDIDHVMRKEVDMDCVTPSNPVPIPHGETIDMRKLLEVSGSSLQSPNETVSVSHFPYEYREPVFAEYNKAYSKEFWKYLLKMQVQNTKWKVNALESAYVQEVTNKEFEQKVRPKPYGVLDYLKELKKGKKRKITVMDNRPFENAEDWIAYSKEVESGTAGTPKERRYAATSSKRNSVPSAITNESNLVTPSRIAVSHDPINACLSADATAGRAGSTEGQDQLLVDQSAAPRKTRLAQPEMVDQPPKTSSSWTNSKGKSKPRLLGGRKAYDFFHEQIDLSQLDTIEMERRLSKINIGAVVEDVISDAPPTLSKTTRAKRSRTKKLVKNKCNENETRQMFNDANGSSRHDVHGQY
ncbi:DNA-directed DNA polymerase gamma MIP1 TDEL_0H03870 [Torulaspora delbrueckii]|uniref:DNA polymerase gamma n=1 Tax=Torulaspora delbrueckii TaxID=4950 RepID=G9A052_TORDE|nr:hypothetical protein TDEL_0H03870 [Torulaspora delbrueckii]CCE94246.1 hypothetical protein TDEL_0H03870 [Torulaspora delbrueckii]